MSVRLQTMNTTKARRLINAYAEIQAKLEMMEREADLRNRAHREARRQLTEALGRLEIAMGALRGLAVRDKPISFTSSASDGATENRS